MTPLGSNLTKARALVHITWGCYPKRSFGLARRLKTAEGLRQLMQRFPIRDLKRYTPSLQPQNHGFRDWKQPSAPQVPRFVCKQGLFSAFSGEIYPKSAGNIFSTYLLVNRVTIVEGIGTSW